MASGGFGDEALRRALVESRRAEAERLRLEAERLWVEAERLRLESERLRLESERLDRQDRMLASQVLETPVCISVSALRVELHERLAAVANEDALLTALVNSFFRETISEKIVTAKEYLGLSDEERTQLLQLLVSRVKALPIKNQQNMCHLLHELFKMVNAMMQHRQSFYNLQNVVEFFVHLTTLSNFAEVQARLETFFDKVFRKINKKTISEVLNVLYSVKDGPDDFELQKDTFIAKHCTGSKLVEEAEPAETVGQPKQPAKDGKKKPRHRNREKQLVKQ